ESATLAYITPLSFLEMRSEPLTVDGYEPRRGEDVAAQFNTVGKDYFRTLRIPLVSGRAFENRDNETGAPVVMVNRTFAERFWGGAEAAIGKRIRAADGNWRTVVGVAADVKYVRLNESPRPYFYLPFEQAYRPVMLLHTRGPADAALFVKQVRAHIAALDPDLEIPSAEPLAEAKRISLLFFEITAAMLFA